MKSETSTTQTTSPPTTTTPTTTITTTTTDKIWLEPTPTTTHIPTHSTTTLKSSSGRGNVVLITGGSQNRKDSPESFLNSAEIFLPNNSDTPCILPDLPLSYAGHTQDGGMLCGGYVEGTKNNCRQWNSTEGMFPEKPVHEFEPGRYLHVSWTPVSEEETFLFGGRHAHTNTSAIVTPGIFNGREGFNLTQLTHGYFWGACSIPDPETDTVIISGGCDDGYPEHYCHFTSQYNQSGFVEYFGNLTHPRKFHGCTSYVADNKRV